MRYILTRYVLKHLIYYTFFISAIVTCAIWLTQSLRLVDVLVNRSIGLSVFFKMLFLLLPDLLSITLPIALMLAVLFVIYRFVSENEFVMMRVSGMSDLALAKPVLWMGGFVTFLLYAINLYLLPLAFQNFKDPEFSQSFLRHK